MWFTQRILSKLSAMKDLLKTALLSGVLVYPIAVMGYAVPTHERISQEAARVSVLNKSGSDVLSDLGLKLSIEDRDQMFPNSQDDQRRVIDLISDGARFEDDDLRGLNHFYDPLNNRPLPVPLTTHTSPDFALEDRGEIGGQDFSFRDTRNFFYNALTLPTTEERERNFGLTFQGLGQVIHHIQDMAQQMKRR